MRSAGLIFGALFLGCVLPVSAEIVVAAHTLRAQHVIQAEDLHLSDRAVPNAASHPSQLIGRETVRAIYAAEPIRLADTRPPALVERNEIVVLVFERYGLQILTEGRALGRAALGESVAVMNLSSRSRVTGKVTEAGKVQVQP